MYHFGPTVFSLLLSPPLFFPEIDPLRVLNWPACPQSKCVDFAFSSLRGCCSLPVYLIGSIFPIFFFFSVFIKSLSPESRPICRFSLRLFFPCRFCFCTIYTLVFFQLVPLKVFGRFFFHPASPVAESLRVPLCLRDDGVI